MLFLTQKGLCKRQSGSFFSLNAIADRIVEVTKYSTSNALESSTKPRDNRVEIHRPRDFRSMHHQPSSRRSTATSRRKHQEHGSCLSCRLNPAFRASGVPTCWVPGEDDATTNNGNDTKTVRAVISDHVFPSKGSEVSKFLTTRLSRLSNPNARRQQQPKRRHHLGISAIRARMNRPSPMELRRS